MVRELFNTVMTQILPSAAGAGFGTPVINIVMDGRGSHSSTFQLNLSRF